MFLTQGLALVDALRRPQPDGAARDSVAAEALQPLFAAAAAFRPEADASNASVALCRRLLATVQVDAIGHVPQEGPQV